jgi:hypothetical protein
MLPLGRIVWAGDRAGDEWVPGGRGDLGAKFQICGILAATWHGHGKRVAGATVGVVTVAPGLCYGTTTTGQCAWRASQPDTEPATWCQR